MKHASWILAVLGGLVGTAPARAQYSFSNTFVITPFGASRSFSYVRYGHHHGFGGYYSRWYFPIYYSPYPYWNDPFLGSSLYYSYPTEMIPAAAAPEPAPRRAEAEPPKKGQLIILPRKDEKAAEKAKPEPLLPGKEASVFRPVQPADRARAVAQAPPQALPPGGGKGGGADRRPDARPKQEPPIPIDVLSRGQQALAAQEYGRAERLLQQAVLGEPQKPLGYFLLAQARFARAKYQEAVDAIHAGMRLQPDWPQADFRSEELYGRHRADFQEQLDHLREVVDRRPADPLLLFLYAYQLWFSGRPEEAKPFFRRARELAGDKPGIDRFLQVRPDGPVAKK